MTTMPTKVQAAEIIWSTDCSRALLDVIGVVGKAAHQLAVGVPVKVAQGRVCR